MGRCYYAIDRMYNVRGVVDRAGAFVERYAYDAYGKPLIRESAGRGDFQSNCYINALDTGVFNGVKAGTLWDPRADLNDDGLVDSGDTLTDLTTKAGIWNSTTAPTVAQAFSDVGNPFMFQGRPNFPIDTALSATSAKNWLNDFRNRFADPTGRWLTRDPIGYADGMNLYEQVGSNPIANCDPSGQILKIGGKTISTSDEVYTKNVKAGMLNNEIVLRMINATATYEFQNEAGLNADIAMRKAFIDAMKSVNDNTKIDFPENDEGIIEPPDGSMWNGASCIGNTTDASAALDALMNGDTILDCRLAVALAYEIALRNVLGKDEYNRRNPYGVDLEAGRDRRPSSDTDKPIPGDWVYFDNRRWYNGRWGPWQGENAVYQGGGKYSGHPLGNDVAEADIKRKLRNAADDARRSRGLKKQAENPPIISGGGPCAP